MQAVVKKHRTRCSLASLVKTWSDAIIPILRVSEARKRGMFRQKAFAENRTSLASAIATWNRYRVEINFYERMEPASNVVVKIVR